VEKCDQNRFQNVFKAWKDLKWFKEMPEASRNTFDKMIQYITSQTTPMRGSQFASVEEKELT